MVARPFIDFGLTAPSKEDSPEIEHYYHGFVQLVTGSTTPVVQLTKLDGNFLFGSYKVYIYSCRKPNNSSLPTPINPNWYEITDYVEISSVTSEVDGSTQAAVQFSAIPYDFGAHPVYIIIDRYGDGVKKYYSNYIQISKQDANFTSILHYRDLRYPVTASDVRTTILQSINLKFYFKTIVSATEIDAYYQVSTEQTVNSRIMTKSYEMWYMPLSDAQTFRNMEHAMYSGPFYINHTRQYLPEALVYETRQELSNVSEQEFITDPNEDDELTPIVVDPGAPFVSMLASTNVLASTPQLASEITTYT